MHLKTRQKILAGVILLALVIIFFPFSFGHRELNTLPSETERFPKAPVDPQLKMPPPAKIVYESVPQDQSSEVVPLVPQTATTVLAAPAPTAAAPVQAAAPVLPLPPAPPKPRPVPKAIKTPAPVYASAAALLTGSAAPAPAPLKPALPALPIAQIRPSVNSDNFLASESPVAHPLSANVQAWVVQLASFADAADADTMVARLRHKGYTAFGGTALVKQATWYRVYVGPMSTEAEASEVASELKQKEHLSGYVHSYQVSN